MKNNALMICLLLALPLFSQKQNLDFRWPKMRTIAGLYYMFSLKEKGTVFHEQVVLNPMSGAMKISYVSADGKTVWVSDKIKNIGFRRDVFWDDKGFTIYQKNAVKKNVEYWHFDYNGKLTAVGKSKYEFPVITLYQSGSKLMAILESNKNDLKNLFIQEIDANSFKSLGNPRPIEVPEGKRQSSFLRTSKLKGTIENHWIFVGADSTRLLFYGKKVLLEEGIVSYEIIVTDHYGKKLNGFTREIELQSGSYVNRTLKSQQHLRQIEWMDEYFESSGSSDVNMNIPAYRVDMGTYGECIVDWGQSAVYFYGSSSSMPENNKIAPTGYFLQKFTLSGDKLWSNEGKLPNAGKKSQIFKSTNDNNEILYINPAKGTVIYRNFPELEVGFDSNGVAVMKSSIDLTSVKKDFSEAGQLSYFDNNHLYGFYHFEVLQTNVLSLLFAPEVAATLQKHFAANGHPTSWYVIQVNQKYCTVLETDPKAESYSVWTVPIETQ